MGVVWLRKIVFYRKKIESKDPYQDFTQFYKLMEQAAESKAKLQYIENAIVANVPNNYIRSMIDGVDYTERMGENV